MVVCILPRDHIRIKNGNSCLLSLSIISLVSSPEPKAQGELLPSANVRRVSSTITSNDISSETARPRTLIFGM